jgi:hypothetical protein
VAPPAATKAANYFFIMGFVAAGGAANHPRRIGATRLGAEVVGADAARVISGSPRCIFFF